MSPSAKLRVLPTLVDAQQRKITYLRVSVTDRCNYRCSYCVPTEGVEMVRRAMLLSFEEIERLVRLMARLGVRRVRLTGGEPTIRSGIVDLVKTLGGIDGINEVAMTTNAHLLARLARPLADAGLASLNVSLDTINPKTFARLTVKGDLARVIAGIDAAVAAGLRVSLNAVALSSLNGQELGDLCEFAWQRNITPRFIEHMPMSDGSAYDADEHLSAAEMRRRLGEHFSTTFIAQGKKHGRGPAQYWACENAPEKRVGIISAMSEHFCSTCNRVRLAATGRLHTCLAYDDSVDLRSLMRRGKTDEELTEEIQRALGQKRDGHDFDLSGRGGPKKHMISIGG